MIHPDSDRVRRGRNVVAALIAIVFFVMCQGGAARADDKPWFSGKTSPYKDTFNGFVIAIPEELKLADKGTHTSWQGLIDGSAVEIHVTTTPMAGVPPSMLLQTLLKSKKEDPNYKDAVALPNVKLGTRTVYAFRCSEADHKLGMGDAKEATDIHRWHLFVFGNDRQYLVQFNAPYAAFQNKKVQAAFEAALKSYALVQVK